MIIETHQFQKNRIYYTAYSKLIPSLHCIKIHFAQENSYLYGILAIHITIELQQ